MRKAALSFILLAAVMSASSGFAQATQEQRTAIEGIIRDYLLANPEVLEEAMNILRQRRQAQSAAMQGELIDANQEEIFNSKNQMVLGNPDGAITLVEFFDYNCGYCKRAVSDMSALISANSDLRVVLKEFPILSEGSVAAARISIAVKDLAPARYAEFHQALFARPGEAAETKALDVARELGLDAEALKAAADRDEVTRNLQEVQKLAQLLQISGTPSYVIGRELIPGAVGFDAIQEKIEAVRTCGKTAC